MSTVQVRNLVVVRGQRQVLRDISFVLPAGQITGLLGPSGCGKTTLMRVLVGVQGGVTGQATVLGEPAGAAGLRRRVGYVTQSPAVYGDLSVTQNLRYFAAVLDVEPGRVGEVLDSVSLRDSADQVVQSLSGGQRARVSLAVALLARPALLIMDEPTVGLDPVLRRDLWALFGELAREGATLLVSSHVMDEAAHCDRLLLMRAGRLVADDTPAALLSRTGEPDLERAFLSLSLASA